MLGYYRIVFICTKSMLSLFMKIEQIFDNDKKPNREENGGVPWDEALFAQSDKMCGRFRMGVSG